MTHADSKSEPQCEDEEPDDLWTRRPYAARWCPEMENEEDAGNETE